MVQTCEESAGTATFDYTCKNNYRGDDETVVSELFSEVPEGLNYEHFHIDWDAFVY